MKTYAIKRSNSLLWSGPITRAEIEARHADGKIDNDWVVCPHGFATFAVGVEAFLDDPDAIQRLRAEDAQLQEKRRHYIKTMERPILLRVGKQMFAYAVLGLIVGRVAASLFFRDQLGQGIPPTILYFILIPTWTVGGLGILATLIGWLQHQMNVKKVHLNPQLLKTEQ